ncbi:MAG: CHASE2 domain-containing protein [Moorea sp. SIO3C2]|nr:CHASE2 domain-containing protein [Moorena sp. SIO3C2]
MTTNHQSSFRLNVWQADSSCLFYLRGNHGQEVSAKLDYPAKVIDCYEEWRYLYLQFYPKLRARELSSGAITPLVDDLGHELEEAKEIFLDVFQRWLGQLQTIRETIQHQIFTIARKESQSKKTAEAYREVAIFIACDSMELARLPWEAWQLLPEDIPSGRIRITRIPMTTHAETIALDNKLRHGKPRILAILGDNTDLNLEKDKQAIKLLKGVAQVEFFDWQHQVDGVNLKAALAAEITDERGWDALFFMGHSDETKVTDGKLAIAPEQLVSISEIKEYLTTAKNQGLQLCVFNSCSGLKIANRLADLGLQVVIMREEVHDNVAHVFLKEFCSRLAQYQDVQEAMLAACRNLQVSEKFVYPSAYLIPSFFSPYGAKPFRIEPWGYQKLLQQWLPKPKEAIALASVLLVSAMVPVQDMLLDGRTFVQAVYRDSTNQFPREGLSSRKPRSVLLIAIDQDSINQAQLEIKGFKTQPMEREYLGKLVRQLSNSGAKVIGIDYLLHTQEPREEKLASAIQSAVSQQDTWFVFGVNQEKNRKVFPKIASPKWSLQGDITFFRWDMELPQDATCNKSCPFAYLLALSHQLHQQPNHGIGLNPNVESTTNFQQQVSQYLQQVSSQDNAIGRRPRYANASLKPNNLPFAIGRRPRYANASLKPNNLPLGMRYIIDFSIPPEQAYEYKPAWEFLKSDFPNIEQQVVIIASGGYDEAEDNFSLPLAIEYWCDPLNRTRKPPDTCPKVFTGGEAHAYMVHHFLSKHTIKLIPDSWMILLAALLGKGTTLLLLQQKPQKRQQSVLILVGATAVYGIIGLQAYISASILIPIALPSIILWFYIL